MPIVIANGVHAERAFLIPQKWTVRSVKGGRIGTSNLFDCMGLVVHSTVHGIGCLGHIEARDYDAAYLADFGVFLTYMISKITKYGSRAAGLQLALFGNAMGGQRAVFSGQLRAAAIAAGVPGAEILDQRNRVLGGGAVQDAGSQPRATEAVIGCITYAPARGNAAISIYTLGNAPDHQDKFVNWGIRKKQLQLP